MARDPAGQEVPPSLRLSDRLNRASTEPLLRRTSVSATDQGGRNEPENTCLRGTRTRIVDATRVRDQRRNAGLRSPERRGDAPGIRSGWRTRCIRGVVQLVAAVARAR